MAWEDAFWMTGLLVFIGVLVPYLLTQAGEITRLEQAVRKLEERAEYSRVTCDMLVKQIAWLRRGHRDDHDHAPYRSEQ